MKNYVSEDWTWVGEGREIWCFIFYRAFLVKYPQHTPAELLGKQSDTKNSFQVYFGQIVVHNSWKMVKVFSHPYHIWNIPRTISFSRMDLLMLIPRALSSEEFAARKKAVLFVSFWQNRSHNFTNFWLPLLPSFPTLFCHRLVPFCTFCCKPCYKNIEKKSSKITVFFFFQCFLFFKRDRSSFWHRYLHYLIVSRFPEHLLSYLIKYDSFLLLHPSKKKSVSQRKVLFL